ncbi:TonB-dependent receptor [Rhodocytophaga aerolata]|uniref:TonB-dependent receptor n=1 Tax=Rhodocytophaga aerolata TaxID=455078 RepID=A0ABT8RBW4_9BACT|nr:TonB-dependent receptor [Rhodocytophaga aerolata]MDO1448703.1 TonB-dependent receptor [Rhodocytophaga aerolata]
MKRFSKLLYSLGCLLGCLHFSAVAQTLAFNAGGAGPVRTQTADQNSTLKFILSELESTYGVSFIYKSELTDLKIEGYEKLKFTNVEEALVKFLNPNGLKFKKVRENFYVVTRNTNTKYIRKISNQLQESTSDVSAPTNLMVDRLGRLGLTLSSIADVNVSGRVTSETNEGLPGVNVTVKGSTNGTVTDANGSYRLTVPENATLVFSYIGYVTEEVAIGTRTTVDVKLVPDIKSLSEVVVVGYGTQERAKVTGAISSVSSEEISALPVASLDAALQGRAAGVTITNRGAPGTNPTVRIRGVGTVGNTDPLYVIDGVPAGGLNAINPNDIESIEVLKDAASAAIYGSRAANGVILVTTKKGTRGKTKITADAYYGVQQAWKLLDLLNRDQYIAYGTDLLRNANAALPDRFSNLGEFANVETDWQDEMFRTAPIQDYNIGISGGTDNALFNISGGYFNQEGIMLGTDFQRASFRANTSFKLGRVSVGQTLTVAFTDQNNEPFSGGRSQLEHMIKSVPYIPVRDASRPGGFRAPDRIDGSDPENPVLNATLRKNLTQNTKLLGTAFADVDLFAGLKYRFQLGLDMNYSTNETFTPSFNAGDFSVSPNATLAQTRNSYVSPVITNQLSFNRTFGAHTIDALAVIERQTSVFTSLNAGGQNALTNDITIVNANATTPNIGGSRSETALLSYIGRINYDFGGKYLLGASIRRDGASRFAPGKKWGWFPSVSAGWRISQESFMDAVPVISDLKLRASYGLTGNWQIGDYGYLNTVNGNFFYKFAGSSLVPAYAVTNLASTNIQWESTAMTNVGLDMGFFEDRLTASFEWFSNETRDMLLPVPIPPSLGYDGAPTENVGNVTNKGVEFMVGYRKNAGAFQWSVNGNISFIKNEFTNLGTGNTIFGPGFEGDPVSYTEVGQPIAYFYGWVVDKIYQTQEEITNDNALDGNSTTPYQNNATAPGDIRFVDLNNDGVINASDRTNIGHFLPDFSYGINATANWKNFDLTLFIQGVSGNEILNTNLYDLEGMTRLFNSGTAVLNRWTPTNTNTDVPRAIANDPNRNSRISSRFIEDGSYLRLKNLSVGYTLPADLLKSWGNGFILNIRVYVSTQNLLTFTGYSGWDPEVGVRSDITGNNVTLSNGVDYGQFPQARTIFGGIQIGF